MATKSLNARVETALDAVNEARDAVDGADLSGKEIATAAKALLKAADRLRKALEEVAEIFDELTEALSAVESELETHADLKLDTHVDALEKAAETIDEVSQLDLESE